MLNFNFKGEKGHRIPGYLRWFLFLKNRKDNSMEKFSYFKSKIEYNVSKMNCQNGNDIWYKNKKQDEEIPYKFEAYNKDNYMFFNKLKPAMSNHSVRLIDGKISK